MRNSTPLSRILWKVIPFLLGGIFAIVSISATNKHVNKTAEYCVQYSESFQTLGEYVYEAGSLRSNKINYLISVRSDAAAQLEDIRETMDYFETLKVPKKLKTEHEAILRALPAHRAFVDTVEKWFYSTTNAQLDQNQAAVMRGIETEMSADGFPAAVDDFLDRIYSLQSSGSRYNRLVWL